MAGSTKYTVQFRAKGDATGARRIVTQFNDVGKSADKASDKFKRLQKQIRLIRAVAAAATAVFTALGGAIAAVAVGAAVVQFARFEKGLSNVQAVSSATTEELKQLKMAALDAAAATKFNTRQATDALYALASAGFSVEESIQGLQPVLNLAAATAGDLGSAAEQVVMSLRGFQLGADQAGRVADVLTAATQNSALNAERLTGALQNASAVSNAYGQSLEDTVAALGILTTSLSDGSTAGTALLGTWIQMIDKSKALGVEVIDQEGKMKSIIEIVRAYEEAGIDALGAMQAFGARGGKGMSILIAQGSDALEALRIEIEANGQAAEVAEKQLDNLAGSATVMMSSLDVLMVSFGETAAGAIRKLVDSMTVKIRQAITWIQNNAFELTETFERMGSVIGKVFGGATKAAIGFARALDDITVAATAAAVAIASLKLTAVAGSMARLAKRGGWLYAILLNLGHGLGKLAKAGQLVLRFLGIASASAAAVVVAFTGTMYAIWRLKKAFDDMDQSIRRSYSVMQKTDIVLAQAEDSASKYAMKVGQLTRLHQAEALAALHAARQTELLNEARGEGGLEQRINEDQQELNTLLEEQRVLMEKMDTPVLGKIWSHFNEGRKTLDENAIAIENLRNQIATTTLELQKNEEARFRVEALIEAEIAKMEEREGALIDNLLAQESLNTATDEYKTFAANLQMEVMILEYKNKLMAEGTKSTLEIAAATEAYGVALRFGLLEGSAEFEKILAQIERRMKLEKATADEQKKGQKDTMARLKEELFQLERVNAVKAEYVGETEAQTQALKDLEDQQLIYAMAAEQEVFDPMHEDYLAIVALVESMREAKDAAEDMAKAEEGLAAAQEEVIASTEKLIEKQKELAEKGKEIWTSFSRDLQQGFSDTIYQMLDGNMDSFEDFFDGIVDLFKQALAKMIAMAIANKIILNVSFGSSFASAMPSLFGAGTGAGAGGLAGMIGGLFAGGTPAAVTAGGYGVGGAAGMAGVVAPATSGGALAGVGGVLMAAAPVLAVVAAAVLLKMNMDSHEAKKTIAGMDFTQSDQTASGYSGGAYSYSGHTGTQAELQVVHDNLTVFFQDLERLVGGSIEFSERLRIQVTGHGKHWAQVWDETGRLIAEMQFDKMEEAVAWGIEQLMSRSTIEDISDNITWAMSQILAMAAEKGLEQAMADLEFLSMLGDEINNVMGITTPAMDQTLIKLDELRAGIEQLGLGADVTAALLNELAEAEAHRRQEIALDLMGQLVGMMERAGVRTAEAARMRAEIEQKIFQLSLMRLEAELKAFGLLTEAVAAILGEIGKWAANLGNFMSSVNVSVPNIPTPKPSGGGRRSDRRDRRRALLDMLRGYEMSTFAKAVFDLGKKFKEAAIEAKKLGVSAERVARAQAKALKDLIDGIFDPIQEYRDNLMLSPESTALPGAQFMEAQRRFEELRERAMAGDIDALQEFPQAAQNFLKLAGDFFGTSSGAYRAIFESVQFDLDKILEMRDELLVDLIGEPMLQQLEELEEQTSLLSQIEGWLEAGANAANTGGGGSGGGGGGYMGAGVILGDGLDDLGYKDSRKLKNILGGYIGAGTYTLDQLIEMMNAGNLHADVIGTLKSLGLMARGGPVLGGQSYIVGEEGPEIFTPSSSGNIIPNDVVFGSRFGDKPGWGDGFDFGTVMSVMDRANDNEGESSAQARYEKVTTLKTSKAMLEAEQETAGHVKAMREEIEGLRAQIAMLMSKMETRQTA